MNLVTLPLATPAQLPPYVASRTLMAFAGFFSSAVTIATGEQRIMTATHASAQPRCIQSSENLEASCSLSLVWSGRSALHEDIDRQNTLVRSASFGFRIDGYSGTGCRAATT